MKKTNKNRNKLVSARPAPLTLEARIMFDGAAVDTAVLAVRTSDAAVREAVHNDATESQVLLATAAPATAATTTRAATGDQQPPADDAGASDAAGADLLVAGSGGTALQDAAARAQEIVRDFLAHADDASLFELFSGGQQAPSQEWLDALHALRQDIAEGRYSVQVIEAGNSELGGAFGAFAASGPDGRPTIFINRDWLAGNPPADAVNRVLVEEFGHALDSAINGATDTVGDEGEAFASTVLHFQLNAADLTRVASEDDHSTIVIDGQAYEVEQASITFVDLYQGTPSSLSQEANQIADVSRIDGTRFRFTSTDPSAPYFSGNNVSGTLSWIDGSGQVQSVDGVISRLFKTNGNVQGLYFYAWGADQVIGTGDTGEAAYLLALDPTKFANGGTYRTSSDPVDTALNRLIVPNSAPVAVNDAVTVAENGTVTGNVLTNDGDANNDPLTVTGIKIGSASGTLDADNTISGVGTLRINSDGSFSFTAAPGYTGPVPVVTYTVSDGQAASVGRLSIAIVPVNDAPGGADKTVTLIEDYAYSFSASDFGFSDASDTPANSLYAVKITTLPAAGTLTLDGEPVTTGQEILAADISRLKYTPGPDGNGNDYAAFTFQVRDNGGTANGGVDTDPTPNTITFNVTAANDAPVANTDSAEAVEAGGVNNGSAGTNPNGNLLDNDSDPDAGDTRSIASASSGAQGTTAVGSNTAIVGLYGTLTLNADGSYTYTVDNTKAEVQALRQTSDTLAERFDYTVRDAAGLTAGSTLTVTIRGANDAPVANNDFNLAVHSSTTPAARVNPSGNVGTNDSDVDNGDTKTITQASKGQVLSDTPTEIGLGTLVEGVESRTYLSFQTQGAGNLKLNDPVTGTGIPPGTYVTGVTNVSGTKTVTLSTSVALDWVTLGSSSLTVGGNSYTVDALGTPSTNVIAVSSVTGGAITAGMNVSGTGIPADTTVSSVATSGGYSFVTLSDALSGTLGTDVAFGSSGTAIAGDYGTLVLKQDGSYTYTVTASPTDTVYDYFTYKTQDAAGAASTAVLKIEINVSNATPPTAAVDSNAITENSASVASDATTNLLNNDTGTSKSVTSAWAANDSDMSAVSAEGTTLTGLYGTINIKSDGSYTYTLDNSHPAVDALKAGQSLSDRFSYRMTDSGGGAAVSSLTITIDGANDGPTAVNDSASAIEAGGVANGGAGYDPSGNVLSSDADTEHDSLSVSAIAGGTVGEARAGSYGSLTLNADGSYTYTVDNANANVQALSAGQTLNDVFTYTASDGNGGTSTATLTVTISGANDAPVNTLPGSGATVDEGAGVAIGGISVADVDDASLSVEISVQNGTLTIGNLNGAAVDSGSNGAGSFVLSGTKAQLNAALATLSYQGAAEFSGTDTLTVKTTDSGGLADVDTLTIEVTPDNRPLTVAGSSVNEASPYAFFSVGGTAGQKISLALADTGSGSGHASGGTDYAQGMEYYDGSAWVTYTGGLVTIPAGNVMLVRVAVLNDTVQEGAETFQLVASNKNGSGYSGNSTIRDDAAGDVYLDTNTDGTPDTSSDSGYPDYLDDDRPLAVDNITVNEASPYAVFTVTGNSGQVVGLALAGGSASVGTDTGAALEYYDGTQWVDYDGTSVTLTDSSLLVRITITQDALYEGAETFGLVATNLGGGSPVLGVATITDDGTGTTYPGTVSGSTPDTTATGLDDDRVLSVSSQTVNEGSDHAVFTVTGNTGEQVALTLVNDSAGGTVAGKANVETSQTLQFWNGSTWESYDSDYLPAIQPGGSLLVRVSLAQEHDSVYEGSETFSLTATYASGDSSRNASGITTLVDDGTGIKYPGTVTNATQPDGNLTVITGSTPDTDGSALDDDRVLTVSSPVVNEASDHAVFTVTGTPGLTATLQLAEGSGAGDADIAEGQTLEVWDGSAWVGYDGSISFPGSGAVLVRVDISAEHDAVFEGPETFQLKASYAGGDSTRTASGTATIKDDGSGVKYPGGVTAGVPDTDASALDDDRTLTVGSPTVNEGSDYAVVSVTGNAGQPVSLQLVESSGAGDADIAEGQVLKVWDGGAWVDYAGSATIPADGVLYVRIDITAEQDSVYEGAESFRLRAAYTSGGAGSNDGSVTIVDDGSGAKHTGTFTGGTPDTDGSGLDDDRPVNAAPEASDTAIATDEDTARSGSLPAATDADGDGVIYATASDPAHGSVTIAADGSYTYTPDANYSGSDSFTYSVSDGKGGSNTYTVTITVNPVDEPGNDAPVASDSSITTDEDTAKTGNLPTATDAEGDSVTYAKASEPAHGTLTVAADGSYTYTPDADYAGVDSFTYTVSDGNGGSNTYTVSIAVNPLNDAPVAANDTASTHEDTALTIDPATLLANDTDIDGGALTIQSVQDAVNGSVALVDGKVVFTPAANYNGPASFTYTVSDGNGGTSTATVNVTVNPVNDAPAAANDTATTSEDTALTIDPSTLVANDTDIDGGALTIQSVQDAVNGTVTLVDGKVVFTPTANYNGPASFIYTVSDGNGGTSTATVNVTVNAVNEAPVAADASVTTPEDTPLSGTLPSAHDADGDALSYSRASDPAHGTIVIHPDGSFLYTPVADYTGSDSFTYNVTDGKGGISTYTVSVNVNPVNDAPAAADAHITTDEDSAVNGTLPAAGDPDGDAVTYAKAGNPAHGSVTVTASGSYTYTPAQDYYGSDSFTYTVSDGKGGSSTHTVQVTVNPVDEPVAPPPPPPAPAPVPAPAPTPVPAPAPAPVPPVVVQPAPFVPVDTAGSTPAGGGLGGTSGNGSLGFGARSVDVLPEHAIRRNAELSDVYTRSEGFRTVVAKADEPALVVFRGVPDQYTESGHRLSLTIPADAFAHTQPKAVVRLAATLQDGQPLPTWVQFNAQTGQFTGEVPPGFLGELRIKVTARDAEGREATALFRVNVGVLNDKGVPVREGGGKASLSEQLKQQSKLIRSNEKLAGLARGAAAPPAPKG